MSKIERTALITGGASGIGYEVARYLAKDGHFIALFDIDEQALRQAEAELSAVTKVWSRCIDVQDAAQVKDGVAALEAERGVVEILLNNVGGSTAQLAVEDIPDDTFDDVISANLRTAFLCTKAVVPAMKKHGWGRIVNYGSIAGRTYTPFTNAAYCAAKAGVIGFTKQCAYEFLPHGIAVNAVAHGPIGTKRILAAWDDRPQKSKDAVMGKIPANRFGTIEEAASVVHFLCGEHVDYMVGAVIDVNGGIYI